MRGLRYSVAPPLRATPPVVAGVAAGGAVLADAPGAAVAAVWVAAWTGAVGAAWLWPAPPDAVAPWRLARPWSAPLRRMHRAVGRHRRVARSASSGTRERLAEESPLLDQLLLDAWVVARWANHAASRVADGDIAVGPARERTVERLRDARRALEEIADAIDLAATSAVEESIERTRPAELAAPALAELHDRVMAHRAAVEELQALESTAEYKPNEDPAAGTSGQS